MPGVSLTFFVQVGRRAHVRTSDGFTGWLSLQTLDQMDIAVKVEPTGKVPESVGWGEEICLPEANLRKSTRMFPFS